MKFYNHELDYKYELTERKRVTTVVKDDNNQITTKLVRL